MVHLHIHFHTQIHGIYACILQDTASDGNLKISKGVHVCNGFLSFGYLVIKSFCILRIICVGGHRAKQRG